MFGSILLSILLIALDQTILATALPRIASDFNSFDKQGWVSSAFILTQTAFILWFGQFLRIYPAKWVMIGSVTIFEVGSVICGASHGVMQLIWGRAISGIGAAGIFVSLDPPVFGRARVVETFDFFVPSSSTHSLTGCRYCIGLGASDSCSGYAARGSTETLWCRAFASSPFLAIPSTSC